MSDSDSDHSEDGFRMDLKAFANHRMGAMIKSTDEVFERWSSISQDRKEEAGQLMKICAFWLPILLQPDESNTATSWAIHLGMIGKNGDLSLKHLQKIEVLEAILRAMEKGSLKKDQAKLVVWIANRFYLHCPEALEDAVHWLERTEYPGICLRLKDLDHINNWFRALQLVFIEFGQFIHAMGTNIENTIKRLTSQPPDGHIKKSEAMKKKGNEVFQKKQYEDAVEFYSKAVKYYPDNHIIYGNRALCYIRCEQYLKAVIDGKRATLLKPLWAKGHYRYCEALFYLGEITMALEANRSALKLCMDDRDGLKDLEQQHQKFLTSVTINKGVVPTDLSDPDCRPCGCPKTLRKKADKANAEEEKKESKENTVKPPKPSKALMELLRKIPQHAMQWEIEMQKHILGTTDQATRTKGSAKDSKATKSGVPLTNGKAAHSPTPKKQKKETERKRSRQSEDETSKVLDSNAAMCKQLKSMVEDAYTALDDHRSRNAEQAFSQALALVETSKSKDLGISTVDVMLLLYGRATALTDLGRPEELAEAQRLLEKIKSFDERSFQCLVFFAIGRVYVKENRYTVALEQFSDSLQMVRNQITPGKLTWPSTKKTVKETQPEYLTNILENAIELCRFPPPPDAICRLENCVGSVKAEIFFTDPDFKGFFQICCSESCVVEYHILCWKNLKTSSFFEKNEKDILQEGCLTPDCIGQICSIKMFGPTGLVKCKFEAAIPKPQTTTKKPRVNQKCTSLKKLKSKEDLKLRRKQYKQSFQDNKADSNEILLKTSDTTAQSQQKAWLLYRDRVLLQISQHMHLLREEKGLPVSALISSLRPWVELDYSRGNQLAGRMLNWKEESLETLGQAVEVLLERKNRVWARVLIQLLSSSLDINPKLNSWACHLNDAGLNAAQSFIEYYAEHLEQIDLALLLNFGPLQDMVIEKLDTRPEFFSSLGLTVTEYLKQALPHDMRLFIWTLEEHRDNYLTCHSILDEYFEMMDGHCSVLKKSEENENSSTVKAKSRGRKKKQREPKGVIVLSGTRSFTPRDEWDQDFFEDDSLSFLLPSDPFSIPSHLREQVTNFEDQYSSSRHQNHYKNILDNNPDPTKESLYDYFAQILEEHGPLVAEDPLLVGELEHFPAEAKQKIQDAGGFEPFLLGSLRFIKMERCIGLAKHAVALQEADHEPSLDDFDDITDPDEHSQFSFPTCFSDCPSVQNGVYPILPNPYAYGFNHPLFVPSVAMGNDCGGPLTINDPICHWTNSTNSGQCASYILANNSEIDCGALETEVSSVDITAKEANQNFLKKHAAIQTCQASMRSVAVNTELNELFESCHGDISKKEKSNQELRDQINMMMNDHEQLKQRRKDDISSLEADFQKTSANIQVTKKELKLFQHKLEEEVKKDQKEKKANQEVLKSLKQEIEQLQQENDSLARRIRGKKTNYDRQLSDFLELSNQSAAEKLSLEDEIKRCKALASTAVRRSLTAQLSVLESNQDEVLFSLYRKLADQRALLSKLDDVAPRLSTQDAEMVRNTVRVDVQDLEKQISSTETQFKEQKNQVKNGTTVSELRPVNITKPPPSEGASASHSTPALIQPTVASAVAAEGHKPPTRTLEPPPTTVADKAIERLSPIFPAYTRSDLMKLIQKLRSSSGGSLYNMTLQDVVSGVTQLILDHQEQNSSGVNAWRASSPAHRATPPSVNPPPVWQTVDAPRFPHSKALNVEDPCIICHEDMSPEDICVLECRHSFHSECIRSWLKEQRTCPTCRDHTLLPDELLDDFPVLPGRKRHGP